MIRVLRVGYNGANNTGAEALLASDIEDVRAVLGPGAHITVPTLFFGALRRLVGESDLVLLVEGSTCMDSWGSPLLWSFLWASHHSIVAHSTPLYGAAIPPRKRRLPRTATPAARTTEQPRAISTVLTVTTRRSWRPVRLAGPSTARITACTTTRMAAARNAHTRTRAPRTTVRWKMAESMGRVLTGSAHTEFRQIAFGSTSTPASR